jgi:GAF domain-containing protein
MTRDDAHDRPAGRGEPSSAYTGEASGWNELAERLSTLSRDLQGETDVEGTLQAIVQAATGTVPGAEHASISAIGKRREVRTRAATGMLARAVDQAQYDTGQGPCLDALYEHRTVRLADLGTERRWPKFAARAREVGAASMLAIQLYVHSEDLGALNLHSTHRDAFSDESEQVGLLFAAHTAVALAGAQNDEHLHTALSHRDIIGQAKGILMERYKISAQDAFRLLVVTSQNTNIKLHEVADYLTRTGQLSTRDTA